MIVDLVGVLMDGSTPLADVEPLVAYRQDLGVPRGEDVTIRLTVQTQDLEIADLTGAESLLLGFRKTQDGAELFSIAGTEVDLAAGRVDFVVPSADTLELSERYAYSFDVVYTDADGKRWQILPVSRWTVGRIVAVPS